MLRCPVSNISIRFLLIQGFLLTAWILLQVAMAIGLTMPGLHPTGVFCLSETILLIFLLLWVYAVFGYLYAYLKKTWLVLLFEMIGIGLFLSAVLWIDWQPLLYGLNSSGDHLMHFTLATLTEWNLRFHWSLTGWCTAFSMGFPLNELYPPGGNIVFCLFRFLTLGIVSREWIYTLVVFATYLTFAFLLYHIARKWFGRTAALLLLLLLLLDGGDGMNFGWPQFFYIGMWASGFGLGVSLFGLSLCADSTRAFTKGRVVILALTVFISVLLHPLFLYTNILWLSLLLLVRLASKRNVWLPSFASVSDKSLPTELGGGALRKSTGIILGLGLAAFWWIPFMFSSEWIYPYGFWGRTMPDIGRELLNGSLFQNATAFHTILGFVGIVWGLFSRRYFTLVLALFGSVNIFLGLGAARTFFHVELAQAFFDHVQLERLVGIGKISGMLLAAGFFGKQLECFFSRFHFEKISFKRWKYETHESTVFFRQFISDICAVSVLVILCIPLYVLGKNLVFTAWRWHVEPMAQRVGATPHTPSYWSYYTDLLHFIESKESERGPGKFFQNPLLPFRALTYDSWRMISAPAIASVGIAGPVYMPAIILGTRPFFFNETELDLANVKYVFDWKLAPYHEIKELEGLTPVYENQEMILYERSSWNGRGWIKHGPGTVELLPTGGSHLRFEISEAKADSHLRLGISRYRKWKASIDDIPVRIYRMEQPFESPEERKLIGFQLRNGVLDIRYEDAWYDLLAKLCSFIFLCLIIVLLTTNYLWEKMGRLFSYLTGFSPWFHGLGSFLDAAVIVIVLTFLITSFFLPKPIYKNKLNFLGRLTDRVGLFERSPDGEKDLCFELDFSAGTKKVHITGLELELVNEDGETLSGAKWQTQNEAQPKIGIADMMGIRLDHPDGSVSIPTRYFQKLHLFVAKPKEMEIPDPVHAACRILFEDGTKVPVRLK